MTHIPDVEPHCSDTTILPLLLSAQDVQAARPSLVAPLTKI